MFRQAKMAYLLKTSRLKNRKSLSIKLQFNFYSRQACSWPQHVQWYGLRWCARLPIHDRQIISTGRYRCWLHMLHKRVTHLNSSHDYSRKQNISYASVEYLQLIILCILYSLFVFNLNPSITRFSFGKQNIGRKLLESTIPRDWKINYLASSDENEFPF